MLYIVATPIGNSNDASIRCKEVLSSVDFILCEDTRKTRALLQRLSIKIPQLISCHSHNEKKRIERAITEMIDGKDAALVSDAGTPSVSDPGMYIVEQAHISGINVTGIPGPSAVSTALSVAGFCTPPFHFLGFPPRKSSKRRKWIIEMSQLHGVVVLFEAGNRFKNLVHDLRELIPDREACLCRELSKTHQEIYRKKLNLFKEENVLGEVTLVIGPGEGIKEQVETITGMKGIASNLADEWGMSKREAYNLLMRNKPT